MSNHNEL